MKNDLLLFCLSALLLACSAKETIRITVYNPSSFDRTAEIAELPAEAVTSLRQAYGDEYILCDETGRQLPFQTTYDARIVFPATVKAGGKSIYTFRPGRREAFAPVAEGDYYPERVDDIAWENDRIAFRAYGPALQASGEKAFGYDVWVKSVSYPIVKTRYEKELNPETKAGIARLRETDPDAARALAESASYHIDHGDGLDFYSVGPTLGAGTTALVTNDSICYPYCYQTYEILDNGPLRFTVKLTYRPFALGADTAVTETRLLSLDAGSHLNKAAVTYRNLSQPCPLVTGLVVHAPSEEWQADAQAGYIAYADVPDPVNGRIYVAAVFPPDNRPDTTGLIRFSPEEKKLRRADGHVSAHGLYRPGTEYVYYWGGGWSKSGFPAPDDWYKYVREYARKLDEPLRIGWE